MSLQKFQTQKYMTSLPTYPKWYCPWVKKYVSFWREMEERVLVSNQFPHDLLPEKSLINGKRQFDFIISF